MFTENYEVQVERLLGRLFINLMQVVELIYDEYI